ncbi:MAG: hypothetical protein AB7K04_01255 [Pseudorhodoplanes sp.]
MTRNRVERRCVLFIGGYELADAERQHQRFVRELGRFERTWNLRASAGPMRDEDGAIGAWTVETQGPNWRVETDYRLLRWDDFVAQDRARPGWIRLPAGILALADFIASGTLFRYFAANWRYALFFLYPVLIVAGFAALGLATGFMVARLPIPGAPLAGLAAAGAVLVLLFVFGGRALQLSYLLDDWIFARDFARRRRPGIDARLDRFARELSERLRDPHYDEVLLAGHSLGAPCTVAVLARALADDPALGAGRPLKLLSTGSSLLKVSLHPAAAWLREAVARVSADARVFWVEYQALVDVINFYKTDPIRALRLPPTGRPIVTIVRIREMLSPEAYKRFGRDFFRLHRQFVMGNERRYFYDYFMLCCGPLSFEARVADPERAVTAFAADGSLQDTETAGSGKDRAVS